MNTCHCHGCQIGNDCIGANSLFWSMDRDPASIAQERELDHAEALAENVAHDLAMTKAQPLTADLLVAYADRPATMPRTLRNRLAFQRSLCRPPA